MATLYDSVRRYENSGLTALYYENKSIGYSELLSGIRRAARYLEERGVGRGDVVTVALPNIPATVYFFYALDLIGAVQNIVHPLSTFDSIEETMRECSSHTAILLETHYGENEERIRQSNDKFFFVCPTYDNSFFMRHAFYFKYKRAKEDGVRIFSADKFIRTPEKTDITERDSSEPSVYLHSGGTTGVPKVIALSDDAISNLAAKVDAITGNIEGRSMLAVLPTFHGFGLGMGIHAPLSNGAASSLMMKFNADKVIKWINQGKVNMIIGVPLLYRKLMRAEGFETARLDNITHCFVGGDNVQPSLIEQFDRTMEERGSGGRLLEGYGLTETVTVCTVNTLGHSRTGSVGRPLRGIEISVRDEEMRELPVGEIGEVYVRGDTVMCGYLSDSDATAATLPEIDGRVWVRTGDLGYLDPDGYLWLKGRKKRLFKISGINVYPSEIEKLACSHEEIREAAMEYFDSPTPHMILYVIRVRKTERSDGEVSREITEILSRSQLKYSMPSEIVFLERFPETKVGKIDHSGFVSPMNKE